MTEPRVIYRRQAGAQRAGRPPVYGSLNTRRLRAASPLQTAHPHSRRASGLGRVVLLLVLALLAVAVVVAASRPAGALSCVPPAPCDAVGDPPPAIPAPPFGACPPGVVIMCPRVAVPVVMK